MTKMEGLRRIIEELKSFGKEDIQSLVNEMDMKDKEDDEDEDEDEKSESTKSDLLKKVAEHFKNEGEEVVKESLQAILKHLMKMMKKMKMKRIKKSKKHQ